MENADTQLNSEILCTDSYIGIKKIFEKREKTKSIQETIQLEDTMVV